MKELTKVGLIELAVVLSFLAMLLFQMLYEPPTKTVFETQECKCLRRTK